VTIRNISSAGVVLAIAIACGAAAGDAHAHEKKTRHKRMDYDTAVKALGSPSTWCDGAGALAAAGERRALADILRAYESRHEGGKMCLLDAMATLGAKDVAHEWFERGGDERRAAVRLMELFADDAHLPFLARAARDAAADAELAKRARHALTVQKQTAAWRAVELELLEADDAALRDDAVRALGRRHEDDVIAALKSRLARETDAALKAKLEAALASSSQK
jgi:hypothetical protein